VGVRFQPKKFETIAYCKKCFKPKEECECGTMTQQTNGKE